MKALDSNYSSQHATVTPEEDSPLKDESSADESTDLCAKPFSMASTAGSLYTATSNLSLSSTGLLDADLTRRMNLSANWSTLQRLDLSRNSLSALPSAIGKCVALTYLNVSRNSLKGLPAEIAKLESLVELHAMSNHFRIRLLPIADLAALPALQLFDLRYNSKLKVAATQILRNIFGQRVQLSVRNNNNSTDGIKKLSAGDRDATQLRSQLEPISTPQLRKRLERTFDVHLPDDERQYDREFVMQQVLSCYAKPRTIRYEQGVLLRPDILDSLVAEMELISWPKTTRERPKIAAEHYIILQRPSGNTKTDSKLQPYRGIWNKAVQAIAEIDSEFATRFTAVAVTHNFTGSPHIDTLNVAPFYGISMGDFTPHDGGKICVECYATIVAEVETRGRYAKVDGRFVHWVTAYEGTRYSLIYYVTSGQVIPQTTAVFPPPSAKEWTPPASFVL